MSDRFRLGLIGAGAIARAYGAAIAGSPVANLVAIADTDVEAATIFAKETGAAAFASHNDLASAAVCDAVIVTTPPVTHAPIVIDLVSRGLPVLCEKPLSVDIDSALRMAQAATENGVTLSMASKFRFTDDVIQARGMVCAGEIGTPLMLENVFTGVVDMTTRWNANPTISGGGVLIDNGTHSVDIIRYFLGPISEVFAVAGAAHPTIWGGRQRHACRSNRIGGSGECGNLVEHSQGPVSLYWRLWNHGRDRSGLERLPDQAQTWWSLGAVW